MYFPCFFLGLGCSACCVCACVWLTCLWKCRSQGGCARRPHPHALRGAPAAAHEVLGLLPISSVDAVCFGGTWMSDLTLCLRVVFLGCFQELWRHLLANRRKVSMLVCISLVNFIFVYVHQTLRTRRQVVFMCSSVCACALVCPCLCQTCSACLLSHSCVSIAAQCSSAPEFCLIFGPSMGAHMCCASELLFMSFHFFLHLAL